MSAFVCVCVCVIFKIISGDNFSENTADKIVFILLLGPPTH